MISSRETEKQQVIEEHSKFKQEEVIKYTSRKITGLISDNYDYHGMKRIPTFISNDLKGFGGLSLEKHPNVLKEGVTLTPHSINLLMINLQALKDVLESRAIANKLDEN